MTGKRTPHRRAERIQGAGMCVVSVAASQVCPFWWLRIVFAVIACVAFWVAVDDA